MYPLASARVVTSRVTGGGVDCGGIYGGTLMRSLRFSVVGSIFLRMIGGRDENYSETTSRLVLSL